MVHRRHFLKIGALAAGGALMPWGKGPLLASGLLDPLSLTKFMDPLPLPGAAEPVGKLRGAPLYDISMSQFTQRLHSQLPLTTVWGYNGSYPGPTIEARSNMRLIVRWRNNLPTTPLLPIDTNVHGADLGLVQSAVHLHGGHVPAAIDGGPTDTFLPGTYVEYEYPNNQRAASLWYHDHALGTTRLNVYAGLAGLWLIRDNEEDKLNLPKGAYEVPLVIQDRTFDTDGDLVYPETWEPEFLGEVILVNGKVWPYLEVEPRKYRFRIYNGSNARFLRLFWNSGPVFNQIGSEGGLFSAPVELQQLLLGNAERADVVIDFSGYAGQSLILRNDAPAPFKNVFGDPDAPDPDTVGQIMEFRVTKPLAAPDRSALPAVLSRSMMRIPTQAATTVRDMSLIEVLDDEDMPRLLTINGKEFEEPNTDFPMLGTTEIWRLVNTTADVHPMHLHLVQFQLLDRQPYDVEAYVSTGQINFTGPKMAPDANEMGWKDTVRANPGEVTRIIMRFTDYTGQYVWHCHILEHEDNEMMRPFEVVPSAMREAAPAEAYALRNFPNPFSGQTSISFSLPEAQQVALHVYNLAGQEVAVLGSGAYAAGSHTLSWDGRSTLGLPLTAGLYVCRLMAGSQMLAATRMVLTK